MSVEVILLGNKGGPAIRPGSQMPTSGLIVTPERRIVVDAGLGVARGITDAGVRLTEIDAIFITHLHSDHYLELGPLLHTAWTSGLSHGVTIHGPPGTRAYWSGFLDAMSFDVSLRIADEGRPDLAALVDVVEYGPGLVLAKPDLTVTAMANNHPPLTHSFALRFEIAGRVIVFSGDTAPMEEMVEFARDADLLVHEAMLTAGVDALIAATPNGDERLRTHILRSHTDARDAGRIAERAGAKRLALYHLVPDGLPGFSPEDWGAAAATTYRGQLHVGRDGLRIAL